MNPRLEEHFHLEIVRAKRCRRAAEFDEAWLALERAHILSQAYAWPHTVAHWEMLLCGFAQRDPREVVGQIARLLLAAPGSLLGRAPLGNTGRSSVGIFTPMPIPEDLQEVLSSDR